MRWLDTILDRVTRSRLTDSDIELLLSGSTTQSHDLADLEVFIHSLRTETDLPRDPGQMATALAATTRVTRRSPRRAMRRVVALAASVAVLFALSGVAMAADDAVPGDFLYGLDRALELIGMGDGGVDERIIEFDTLIQRGEDERAFELLDEFAESASEADSAKAQSHIELAATKSNIIAAAAQEKVAEKKAFIEDNKGNGLGLDGKAFGQGVADQTQSSSNGVGPQESPGNSDNANQGPPDHAASGSEKSPPGQSGDTGPANPPQSNSTPPDNSGSGNNSGSGSGNGNANSNSGGAGNGNGGGPSQNAGKANK